MECGYLKKSSDDKNPYAFAGEINLGRRLNGSIGLIPNPRANGNDASDTAPDYIVTYKYLGSKMPARNAGSAWLKNSDKSGDFLSITMDDPDWSGPLNLAAFPENHGGSFRIIWSRPRRNDQLAAA